MFLVRKIDTHIPARDQENDKEAYANYEVHVR